MTGELERRRAYHEIGHVAAALAYAIPIISVNISNDTPHMHRGYYRPSHDIGLESMVVLCLCGAAAELEYVGPITDGGDRIDVEMARDYLNRKYDALRIGFELNRLRDSARALVTTPLARAHIPMLADALMRLGHLTGEQIAALATKQQDLIHWVMSNHGHTLEEATTDLREFGGL